MIYFSRTPLVLNNNREAQYFNKVRQAELHYISREPAKALAIYDEIYQENRALLLSQDCLNAAFCVLRLEGFMTAQRFLNLLAVRNIPFTILEQYAGIKEKVALVEWNNYKQIYKQLFETARPSNEYVVFKSTLEEHFRELHEAKMKMLRLTFDEDEYGNLGFYQKNKETGDSIFSLLKDQAQLDSLMNLPTFKDATVSLRLQKLLGVYVEFFREKDWPHERDITDNYPGASGGKLLQYAGFLMR